MVLLQEVVMGMKKVGGKLKKKEKKLKDEANMCITKIKSHVAIKEFCF